MKIKWGIFLLCFVAFLEGCQSTPETQSIGFDKTPSPSATPTVQIVDTIIPSPNPSATREHLQKLHPGNYLIYFSNTYEELRLTSLGGTFEYAFTSVPKITSFDLSADHKKFVYQDVDGMIWIHMISSSENVPAPQPNILNGAWYESGPRWSPDGSKLVYAAATISIINEQPEVEEFPSLWVSYINEDKVEKVTDWPFIETDPTWSPDEQWIAFTSDHENIDSANGIVGDSTDLYIMPTSCLDNPDKCDELSQKVTNIGSSGWLRTPTWSPDSSQIAFVCVSEDNSHIELCVYNLDSKVVNHLAVLSDHTARMDWSPNSDQVIFTSNDDIYLIQSNGGSSINLTNSTEWEEDDIVQWSPCGHYIAFSSSYSGSDNTGFSIINLDNMERVDYHEMISGEEMFLSWLVIPESIEISE